MAEKHQGDIRVVHGEIDELPDNIQFLENKSEEFKTIYLTFKKLLASKNTNRVLSAYADLLEVSTAIIDLDANVLASSRWQRICTDFHRVNSESCQKCLESDMELANQLDAGKDYTIYNCKNGMVDCASPVIIEGHHIANVFIGQFLSKKPDKDFFRANAQRYGFDEKAYMQALDEVSIVEEEKSQKILHFLTEFTKFISSMALDKIRVVEAEKKYQDELSQKIKEEVEKNRKKDRQMLVQSRFAQMGEIISTIAHQWSQPISVIAMGANNILADIAFDRMDKNRLKNTAKNITAKTKELSIMIDDFGNLHKQNKEAVVTKLEDVVDKSVNITKHSLINNHINIIKEYSSDEDIELFDGEMMRVILNILKNAEENFQEKQIENRKIIIKTENRTISICDNGKGVPKEIIDEIFEPYFSTKDEKNGVGLGLYISKTIIEKHHNGKLSVKNTDEGVCFTIELRKRLQKL